MYKLHNGYFPTTEQGLQALVEKPETGRIPNNYKEGGYIGKIPLDPWANPYIYLSPGVHGDYDLISYGADGEPGGEGKDADVESWNIE
jgi:general secretion pathway protein G